MQLRRVKISNVLSFPYQSTFKKFQGVVFDAGEKAVTNTLIGPNGSGKSNFLDIIGQVLRAGLFVDYVYRKSIYDAGDIDQQKLITKNTLQLSHITKHTLYPDKKSQVGLEIVFNTNDYDNLYFLCKYRDTINMIIKKYSHIRFAFPSIDYSSLLFHNSLSLSFTLDIDKQSVSLRTYRLSKEQKFLLLYLQHIELIQICMNIYNDYERKSHQRKRYPLKNTFALLSSRRGVALDALIKDVSVMSTNVKSVVLAKGSAKSDPKVGYQLCLSKIMHHIRYAQKQCTMDMQSCIDQAMEANPYIVSLNKTIFDYLGYTLQVDYEDGVFYFGLVDRNGQYYHDFAMLSSGEQSFLLIIMSLYGYDMENGLMIVDEPELHLHPQMQKNFVDMLDTMSEKWKMQFIVATHSPIMINEKNVGHVYKCSKKNGGTFIHNPPYKALGTDEANLIHMLKFGNVAKMFFVDTIIMVEGETDAYFFDYYLDYLRKHADWGHAIANYEIININGKGSYRKWEKFLSKFGLDSYFLGDWDNILDRGIVSLRQIYDKIDDLRRTHHLKKVQRYGKLVSLLSEKFPDDHAYIDNYIQELYYKHLFILKKGDLETYLGLPLKGLDEVVSFCHKQFDYWMGDARYDVYRKEIDDIFYRIFSMPES